MGRMHSGGKGISASALPYKRTPPNWLKISAQDDLYHLIKKAVAIRKHLERNRKDKDSKFRLILVESRIHRLARYYKKTKKLAPVWKYESSTASTLTRRTKT
uniref:Small ribosomal subunit protein uS15 N-terminal domain-containing protein n=1 Tax=Salix viminalis TaxID=40686 RepID=A0A6N2MK23_SALVM